MGWEGPLEFLPMWRRLSSLLCRESELLIWWKVP